MPQYSVIRLIFLVIPSAAKLFTTPLFHWLSALQSLNTHPIPDLASSCDIRSTARQHTTQSLSRFSSPSPATRTASGQSSTGTIAPSRSRPGPQVHLRTLSSQSRPSNSQSTSNPNISEKSDAQHLEGNRRSSYTSATDSDEFSLWSDTGDIADLVDEEDPLRIELDPLNSEGQALNGGTKGGRGQKKKKHVHYQDQDHLTRNVAHPGIDKEAIYIPEPAPRRISKGEKFLAIIMDPSHPETARMRGLVGKPLL